MKFEVILFPPHGEAKRLVVEATSEIHDCNSIRFYASGADHELLTTGNFCSTRDFPDGKQGLVCEIHVAAGFSYFLRPAELSA